jgi:pimeloyl-ACP methyl ester carboxylesterase
VTLSTECTAVFGVSAGGELTLAHGLRHPHVYGAVFCASHGGAFWREEFPLMVAWASPCVVEEERLLCASDKVGTRKRARHNARRFVPAARPGGASRKSTYAKSGREGWSTTIRRPSLSALTECRLFAGTIATTPGFAI